MENFISYNPVKLHFGKNVCNELGETALLYGKKVLLVYGKGSVVKNGYYDIVKNQLENSGLEVIEYSGIKSNPIIEDVDEAVRKVGEHKINLIVALGGGSVIDSAKIISLCIPEKLNGWDVMKSVVTPKSSIPLIVVLTIAATGSEMNHFAVVQNNETKEKPGYRNELIFPKHSFLDPQFTFSVPPNYTSYGVTDLIAHAFENYFGYGESPLSDRFTSAIIKEALYYGPLVLKEPENYDYRANIMWQATCALNGLTASGRTSGDWGVHSIGHTLSLLYDLPHGASLSIAYPAWLKIFKDRIPKRIKRLAKLIYGTDNISLFIRRLEDFFSSINSPVRLNEAGIGNDKHQEIIDVLKKNNAGGFNHKLNEDDYIRIVELMAQ